MLLETVFCLSLTIHQEAGGQPQVTKEQVGYVVLNRIADPSLPNTCEDVVLQQSQFSWTITYKLKDGEDLFNHFFYTIDNFNNNAILLKDFASSQQAAQDVLDGNAVNRIGNSINFVTSGFHNNWTAKYKRQKIHGLDFLHKR